MKQFTRRTFVGTAAMVLAGVGFRPGLHAQSSVGRAPIDDYDSFVKLASNENPYGPSEAAMSAMNDALKYVNRYRYPDSGLVPAIAALHQLSTQNVLTGAGSSEILHIAAAAFLKPGKKVIGVEPTYSSVYEYATGLKTNAIRLPLSADHRQDTAAMIKAVKENAGEIGLVYVCNPNNPTGRIVPKQEIKRLLDEIPREIPVLIDEAYHDFVDDPDYATSVPYIAQGRSVIVARTFSKIFGLAGMRLGYGLAPEHLMESLRPHASGMSVNALVKFGAVAALKDTASQERVRSITVKLRKNVTEEIERLGYPVMPSQGNYFMAFIRRPVSGVIQEFRQRGVLVGRPFPPMMEYLRVSIGTESEMDRFLTAFKEIFPAR